MKWALMSLIFITLLAGCAAQPRVVPGTFFADMTGSLKQDASKNIATFTFDARSPSQPPLTFVVEPDPKLAMMQTTEKQTGASGRFRVTGQVTQSNTLEIERAVIVQPS
jgi:hypothetical protein